MGERILETSTEGVSAFFVLFLLILAVALVLSKLLHDKPLFNNLGEVGIILLLGITAGFVVNLFVDDLYAPDETDGDGIDESEMDNGIALRLLSFSPQVFFSALLPPIIFNSGYHLKRELFFRHIGPVTLFAVVGTVVSSLFTSFSLELIKGLGWTGAFEPSTSKSSAIKNRSFISKLTFSLSTAVRSLPASIYGASCVWGAHFDDRSSLYIGCISREASGSSLILLSLWRVSFE
jgi:Sodium/hydrogen exchanger family